VYRVPPLTTVSGYRANDWNLATPLQTCGFQVERRDNDLYLLFTVENHTKLFALSKVRTGHSGISDSGSGGSGSESTNTEQRSSIESVVDSSRYFVTKIQDPQTGKEAMLGFGFRDREVAIDLMGNLQQFQRSIQREIDAKNMKVTEIPPLQPGHKMHISLPPSIVAKRQQQQQQADAGATKKDRPSSNTTTSRSAAGGHFLLKKPPSSLSSTIAATSADASAHATTPSAMASPILETLSFPSVNHMNTSGIINMSEMELLPQAMDIDSKGTDESGKEEDNINDNDDDDENSDGAVAKSVIHDDCFFGLEDEDENIDQTDIGGSGGGGGGSSSCDRDTMAEDGNVNMGDTNDDDDFGDFQGA
jgi:hypothetical protein